jgi:hypothetical protein
MPIAFCYVPIENLSMVLNSAMRTGLITWLACRGNSMLSIGCSCRSLVSARNKFELKLSSLSHRRFSRFIRTKTLYDPTIAIFKDIGGFKRITLIESYSSYGWLETGRFLRLICQQISKLAFICTVHAMKCV